MKNSDSKTQVYVLYLILGENVVVDVTSMMPYLSNIVVFRNGNMQLHMH